MSGAERATVRAVIFDWGGTLTPWHEVDFVEEAMSYCSAWDADGAQEASDRLLAATDAAWRRAREQHTSATFEQILADAGFDVADERHEPALAAYRTFWERHTHTDPQVKPLWEALRDKGIRVGVLSNTIWTRDYHRGIFERDGVLDLIDADVYSSEIAFAKPHVEAFRAAADAVEVEPQACVYVGDRIFEDVHGSQRAGMRGVLVPHSNIPVAQQVSVDAVPDAVIHELFDLLPVIDGWC